MIKNHLNNVAFEKKGNYSNKKYHFMMIVYFVRLSEYSENNPNIFVNLSGVNAK